MGLKDVAGRLRGVGGNGEVTAELGDGRRDGDGDGEGAGDEEYDRERDDEREPDS